MRTIGFRSNLLFIFAAAFGLIASLDRAWYAPTPVLSPEEVRIGDVNGPVEDFFTHLAREFSTATGTTGWHAFSSTDTILAALIAVTVVSGLCTLVATVEQPAREVLRLATFAMLGIVVVKLVNTPDAAGLVERRQGAWIALFVTGIMASSANAVYNAPLLRRRKPGRSLYDSPSLVVPDRSHVFDTPGSVSPDAPGPAQPAA
jgi:hypothetical protein